MERVACGERLKDWINENGGDATCVHGASWDHISGLASTKLCTNHTAFFTVPEKCFLRLSAAETGPFTCSLKPFERHVAALLLWHCLALRPVFSRGLKLSSC